MDDIAQAKEHIATFRNQVEMERAFTIDRIERGRRFYRGDDLKKFERREWEHFYDRVHPIEKELRYITELVAQSIGWQVPTIIVERRSPPATGKPENEG